MIKSHISLLCLVFLFLNIPKAGATVYYVSNIGSDAASGTSTSTAKATILSAYNASSNGDTIKISSGLFSGDLTQIEKNLLFEGGYTADFQEKNYKIYRSTAIGKFNVYSNVSPVNVTFKGISFSSGTNVIGFTSYNLSSPTFIVQDCVIFNSSGNAISLVGIQGGTGNIIIASNTITNCSAGINISMQTNLSALIHNNAITNMPACGDNTLGGNGIIVSYTDEKFVISSNTIAFCENRGIYGSGSVYNGPVVRNNIVHRCGWGGGTNRGGVVYTSGRITIIGNLVYKNYSNGITLDNAYNGTIVKNNTIANNVGAGVLYGLGTSFSNNIIFCNTLSGGINEQELQGVSGDLGYNVFGNNEGGPEEFYLGANYEAGLSFYKPYGHDNLLVPVSSTDTIFVDVVNDDYHLAANSIAIDAGDPDDPVGNEPLPNGNRIDCGAYGGTQETAVSETIPPAAVTDLTAIPGTNIGEIKLIWSVPGDDGTYNRHIYGARYYLKYATFSLTGYTTQQWWDIADLFTPQDQWIVGEDTTVTKSNPDWKEEQPMGIVGKRENFILYDLTPGVTYFFMLKTRDNSGNLSVVDDKSTDTATMANAYAQGIGNSIPVLGHTMDNILGSAAQRRDDSDLVDIKFRIKDSDGPGDISLFVNDSAQYSLASGPWNNIDKAHLIFPVTYFAPATDFSGTEYTVIWVTTKTFSGIENDNVAFRFKVNDGNATSLYASTGVFSVDTESPGISGRNILSRTPVSIKYGWSSTTDPNFDQFYVYYASYSFASANPYAANKIWNASNDALLYVNATTFTVITGLSMYTTYWFYVQPRDAFGHAPTHGLAVISTMTLLDVIPPAAVSDLTVSLGPNVGDVKLQWTSPGDDGTSETIPNGLYEIKYSSVGIITALNYSTPPESSYIFTLTTSVVPGRLSAWIITGLIPSTTYWFALKTCDDGNLWSVWNSTADVASVNTGAYGWARYVDTTIPAGSFSGNFSESGGALYNTQWADEAYGIAVDTFSAGGPYLYSVGFSSINGGYWPNDAMIIKYDQYGNKSAARLYNGVKARNDIFRSVYVAASGYIYAGGNTIGPTFNDDYLVAKYDQDLVLLTSTTINGLGNNADNIYGIVADAQGNIIVSGRSYNGAGPSYDVTTIKYNSELSAILSSATFDSGGTDYGYRVAVDSNSNIYVTAACNSKFSVLKYNSYLTLVSSIAFNRSSSNAYSIKCNNAGEVIVSGDLWENPSQDLLVIRYNSDLSVMLSSITFNSGANDYGYGMTLDNSDNVILAAKINSDIGIVKYSSDLSLMISSQTYDSATADSAEDICVGLSSYVYVAGYSDNGAKNDFRTIRFNVDNPDLVAPSAVTDLLAQTGLAEGQAKLNWSVPGDDNWSGTLGSGSGFKIQYSTSADGFPPGAWAQNYAQVYISSSAAAPYTRVSYTVTSLTGGTTYYFRAWHRDEVPNWAVMSNLATAYALPDIISPSSITDLYGTCGINSGEIILNWTTPGDDGSMGSLVSGANFKIQYSTYSEIIWSPVTAEITISTAAAPFIKAAYTITSLSPGVTYFIQIWAADDTGNISGISNGTTAQAKINLPFSPVGFSATVLSTTTIRWFWQDIEDYEQGYRIKTSTGAIIATLSANTTFWIEENLTANTSSYRYAEVYNLAGSSAVPGILKYTFANPPVNTAFTGVFLSSVTFNWELNGNADGTRWEILRSTNNFAASTTTMFTYAMAYTSITFTDMDMISEASYYYKVRAFNAEAIATNYDITISTYLGDATAPAQITDLTGTNGTNSGEILLSWTTPGDNGYLDNLLFGSKFKIQYSTSADGVPPGAWADSNAQILVSTSGISPGIKVAQAVTGLVKGTTYFIRLWTTDDVGNCSGISNATTAQASYSAAVYVTQNVPISMCSNTTYYVSVTMQNTGITNWTKDANFRLGSQNPMDNQQWLLTTGRVELDVADNIAPGQQKTFSFVATATAAAGAYNFRWQMVQEGVEWFGDLTQNATVYIYQPGLPVETVDTLEHFLTDYSTQALSGTHAHSQLVGSNDVYFVKWSSMAFELYEWDDDFIYMKEDQSYLINAGYAFYPGKWMKRQMNIGEKIDMNSNGLHWFDSSCNITSQGIFMYENTLEAHVTDFYMGGDMGTQDVIILKYFYYDKYEKFYYSKEWGWIMWELYVSSSSSLSYASRFNVAAGSTITPSQAFTKTAPPGSVTDLSAAAGTNEGEVQLVWSAPGDDRWLGDLITGSSYKIQYSTFSGVVWSTAAFNITISTTAAALSRMTYSITGLSPGVTYYISLWTKDEKGNCSGISNCTTTQAKINLPLAPVDFNAIALSTSSIKWFWQDIEENELGYRIRTSTGGLLAELPVGATSWIEERLTANTSSYRYGEVYNLAGSSACAGVTKYSFAKPPVNTAFMGIYLSSITFGWELNGNPNGTKWEILRSTNDFTASTITLVSYATGYTNLFFADTDLVSGVSYYYRVCSFNGEGTATDYDTVISTYFSDRIAPSQVTDLLGVPGNNAGEIKLNWSFTGDDYQTGYFSAGCFFRIKHSTYAGVNWQLKPVDMEISTMAAVQAKAEYAVTGLTPGVTYFVHIWLADEAGNWSDISNTLTVQARINLPLKPENFIGTALSTASIKWSWEDNSDNETEFRIYSSTGYLITVLPEGTTEYLESALSENTAYARFIKTWNLKGENVDITSATVYTYANTPAVFYASSEAAHSIMLSWAGATAQNFRIDKSTDNLFWSIILQSTTSLYCEIDKLFPGTTYYFAVWSYNAGDYLSLSSTTLNTVTKNLSQNILNPGTGGVESKSKMVNTAELKTEIRIPAGAISEETYIDINLTPLSGTREADILKLTQADDIINADNQKYLFDYSIVELNMYDLRGNRITGAFLKNVTLALQYPDENNDGIIDDTIAKVLERRLNIYRLNEISGEWEFTGGNVLKTDNTVEAELDHFSIYCLIANTISSQTDLKNVIVYPNPFKNEAGSRFNSASGMIFDNLTANVNLKIYNIAGELIYETVIENGSGRFDWQMVNNTGEQTASGVYIYFISNRDNTLDKTSGKIAIIK